ncbi:MAG TPA: DUF3025 domain-containing protein, partial [Ramlibacter sp.]|nr:DUF3025 domain-containing protein [Ramlibacter sp.]
MIADVDWAAPWYGPWREAGERVARRCAGDQPLAGALNGEAAADPRFVPQSALPEGVPYEQFIFERRECPTRDNLHDLFNGLCWLRFPRTKARLNELQASEIRRHGVGGRR